MKNTWDSITIHRDSSLLMGRLNKRKQAANVLKDKDTQGKVAVTYDKGKEVDFVDWNLVEEASILRYDGFLTQDCVDKIVAAGTKIGSFFLPEGFARDLDLSKMQAKQLCLHKGQVITPDFIFPETMNSISGNPDLTAVNSLGREMSFVNLATAKLADLKLDMTKDGTVNISANDLLKVSFNGYFKVLELTSGAFTSSEQEEKLLKCEVWQVDFTGVDLSNVRNLTFNPITQSISMGNRHIFEGKHKIPLEIMVLPKGIEVPPHADFRIYSTDVNHAALQRFKADEVTFFKMGNTTTASLLWHKGLAPAPGDPVVKRLWLRDSSFHVQEGR